VRRYILMPARTHRHTQIQRNKETLKIVFGTVKHSKYVHELTIMNLAVDTASQALDMITPLRNAMAIVLRWRLEVGADENNWGSWRDGVDQAQPRSETLLHDKLALCFVKSVHVILICLVWSQKVLLWDVVSDWRVCKQYNSPAHI
jgi:hypothetical protein